MLLFAGSHWPDEARRLWRDYAAQAARGADESRLLGEILWNVSPYALRAELSPDEWEDALSLLVDLKIAADEGLSRTSNAAVLSFAAMRPDWFWYKSRFDSVLLMLEPAASFVESYVDEDAQARLAAAHTLKQALYLTPSDLRLVAAAALIEFIERMDAWQLLVALPQAKQALHDVLLEHCGNVRPGALHAEQQEELAGLTDKPPPPLPRIYERIPENERPTAMAFFRAVYEPIAYLERPYADQVRRDDPILYRRLSVVARRGAKSGRWPRAMADLFPSRLAAKSGAKAWTEKHAEDQLAEYRARNRRRVARHRAKKKGRKVQ